MSRYNKDLGDFGESAAATFLKEKGYSIKKRNFRTNSGEIDIIAENEEWLVFAEVKTRSGNRFGFPAEAVGLKKQQHICKTAERYIMNNPSEKEIRFDVIEVYAVMREGAPYLEKINHIENAVLEV